MSVEDGSGELSPAQRHAIDNYLFSRLGVGGLFAGISLFVFGYIVNGMARDAADAAAMRDALGHVSEFVREAAEASAEAEAAGKQAVGLSVEMEESARVVASLRAEADLTWRELQEELKKMGENVRRLYGEAAGKLKEEVGKTMMENRLDYNLLGESLAKVRQDELKRLGLKQAS